MVYAYYLEIWMELKPNEPKDFPEQKLKVQEVKRFYKLEDAWKYVLGHSIQHYIVAAGECLIDQT
jgi:hypothetical protein